MKIIKFSGAIVLFLCLFQIPFGVSHSKEIYLGHKSETPKIVIENRLKNFGIENNAKALIEASQNHERLLVRWLSVQMLGLRKEREAIDSLQYVMENDKYALVKKAAAWALSQMGEKAGIERLTKFMDQAESLLEKIRIASQLAGLGYPYGFPYLVSGANSENELIKKDIILKLPKFFRLKGEYAHISNDAMDLYLSLGFDKSEKVREYSLKRYSYALSMELDRAKAVETLRKISANEPNANLKEKAEKLLLKILGPQ